MKTYRLLVSGLVQGIGFRPFVAELAETLGLDGKVKNLGGIVEIMISGEEKQIKTFLSSLRNAEKLGTLSGCRIEECEIKEVEQSFTERGFFIEESKNAKEIRRFLPVDLSICDRCITELQEKKNRRYHYPFISCTACGPRFSIQRKVPYDRETITMGAFPMCSSCLQEYTQKRNIRRHAQTIACKDCGPRLSYVARDCPPILEEQQAITSAVQALKEEKIGAIKDIGGYHFACSPFSSIAVKRLRKFKHREKKPFAVMFSSMEEMRNYCIVSEHEEKMLTSTIRPIVLLEKKENSSAKGFTREVCGKSSRIGAMLPCNPLQILLLEETGALVMTSGNRGGEPICISEEEVQPYIGNGIDFMLTHDREILTPLDDSIYQFAETETMQLIRRARGLVPEPIQLKRSLSSDVFAAGGDLKAVFGIGKKNFVYLSQHFGDLEEVRCIESRKKAKERMMKLFEIYPEVSIGDLHPLYVSGKETKKKVQHHHAHIMSVIAEHGLEGKVLGVACDGTGYGTDGTVWGSEFLLCEAEKMRRVGQFSSVKLLGGDSSAKNTDMTLYSYMLEAKERGYEVSAFFETNEQVEHVWEMAWKQNINTITSSSMGRLFDATAALLDICHFNSYEGECAILLEQAAHKGREEGLRLWRQETDKWKISCEKKEDRWQLDSVLFLTKLYQWKFLYSKEVLAYLFHHAIAVAITETACRICKEQGVTQIALSGGTFLNRILLKETVDLLKEKKKIVYWNEKVPCGDGGIALGQMYLATF